MYTVFAVLVLSVTSYNFLHVMFWRLTSNDQCQWAQDFSDTTRIHFHRISKGSSAERAGLKTGDILLSVSGTPVLHSKEAARLMLAVTPGEVMCLRIERDHREQEMHYARAASDTALPFMLTDRIFERLTITNIVKDGVTDRVGIKDGDILLRIDSVSINSYYGSQYQLNIHEAGSTAQFLIDRDGERLTFDVEILKVFDYIFFAQFLLGLGFLLVGYFVVMARPQGSIQRKFARYGIYAMLFFGLSTIIANPIYDPMWKVNIFVYLRLVARVLAPPIFVSFFLHFPVRRSIVEKRWLVPLLYGGSALAIAIPTLAYFGMLDMKLDFYIVAIARLVPIIYFFVGLGFLMHSYFTKLDHEQRLPLRPILQSSMIGIAAFIYVYVIATTYPFARFLEPYLLLPALLIIGIPPAFGYSIVKYRLMDITVIVKRSIMYGLITAAIAAIYLGVVFGLGSLLGTFLGETDNQLLTLIAFVVIALLFDPLKQRVQSVIDRLFYRERLNYQKALLEFSHELPRQINLEQILHSMVNRISSTMHVESVSVSLCDDEEGCHVISRNIPEELCSFTDKTGGVLALLKTTRVPQSFALLDEDTRISDEEDREKLRQSRVKLMVPMFLQDRLIGSINVGTKMSGNVYSQEDVDLLSTVGSQAAIAIENARLHISELDKHKIKEQLSIAQRIQQGLLPKSNPPIPELDITGISIPALTVGGDYYDYIPLPNNKLLVAVGDVSGKGMSAALYMSKVQGMIRFAAQLYDSPKVMLSKVNRLIYDGMERNSFITMILAMFDLDARTVTVCRAGHTRPLVALNGGMNYLGSDGMGLGLEPGEIFDSALEEKSFSLQKDGLLLLYSDGLTEAMDIDMNEFGEERVYRMVHESPNATSSELQDMIIREVERHRNGAEQNDDITLVVIRVR